MKLGGRVTYRGQRYVLRGLDPFDVDGRKGYLEDAETHQLVNVPLKNVEAEADESVRTPAKTSRRPLLQRVVRRLAPRRS